jgi:hypothetical protein
VVSIITVFVVMPVMNLLECKKDTMAEAYEESSVPADADFVMITPFVNSLTYATTLETLCNAFKDEVGYGRGG